MAIRSNKYWPEDLMNEILLKLPIKSILRFKCVAKTWYNLIKSPTFVSHHLSLSKKKNNNHLVVHYLDAGDCEDCYLNLYPNECDHHSLIGLFDETFVPYPSLVPPLPDFIADNGGFDMISAANGLVCLSIRDKAAIWNPATGECKILPEINVNVKVNAMKSAYRLFGFGWDRLSKDYKVIVIVTVISHHRDTGERLGGGGAIYTMSTNSWRVLKERDDIVDMFSELRGYHACLNGICYWEFRGGSGKLLAFHLGNETFRVIHPIPEFIPYVRRGGQLLPFHDDCICYWLCDNQSYTIWMLNDEQEQGHWTKLLRIIEHLPRVREVFTFWGKRKALLLCGSDEEKECFLYDMVDAKVSRDIVGVKSTREYLWKLIQVHPYQESLVGICKD